jgi:hypothetical protein
MGRLSVTHALALRRLAVAGGALAASLIAAVHCAMTFAPWAFGLAPHHHDAALVGPEALAAHAAAALLLALLATRLDAWLARAVAAMAAVRRWLAPRPAAPAVHAAPPGGARRDPRRVPRGTAPCRGPPLLRPT